MLPENIVMPAVKKPAAIGLSRATSRAMEWRIYCGAHVSGIHVAETRRIDKSNLVLGGGAPARDLGRV